METATTGQAADLAQILESALSHLTAQRGDQALVLFNQALALGATMPEVLLGHAVALAQVGKVDAAVVELTELVRQVPQFVNARNVLAQLSGNAGSVPTATNGAPAASLLGKQPSIRAGSVGEVIALLQQGAGIDAMHRAEAALRGGEKSSELYFVYGTALEAVGRCEEALEAAKQALTLDPTHGGARGLCEKLVTAVQRAKRPALHPEQRSYQSSAPRTVLQSIQNASHNYSYRGVPMIKNCFDFALYPLLFWNIKPKTVIEIGTKDGGSALWFADMMNNFGIDGKIYSVDIVKVSKVSHPRVTFLEGNGRKLETVFTPDFLHSLPRPLLVIEDADHSYETSIAVLNFFHSVLGPDEVIVIEDGIISDLDGDANCNSGPHRALKEFIANHPGEYGIDENFADFFGYNYTWCTNGFLRKKRYPLNAAVPKELVRSFNTDDPAAQGIESQMSTNERFQLYYILSQLARGLDGNIRFVEIGSHAGASLKLSHRALTRRFPTVQGFAVEPAGTPQFYEVLNELSANVAHLKALSHEAAPSLADFFLSDGLLAEVIFVDGDHTYEGVKRDIINYFPLLRPGGVMVFHDYLPALNAQNRDAIFFHHGGKEPGIRQACEELMEREYGCEVIDLPLLYPTDPTQTQPHLPVIPGVASTVRAYRKPG